MSTPKGIFLELIKPDGQPERQLCQYEALHMCLTDPINTYLRGNRKRGSVSKDRWGTTISFPEDAPGPIPVHTPELSVCTDVTPLERDHPRARSERLLRGLGGVPHALARRRGRRGQAPRRLHGHRHF